MSTASVPITLEPPGEMFSVAGGSNESVQGVRGLVKYQDAVRNEQAFIIACGNSLSAETYQLLSIPWSVRIRIQYWVDCE